MTHPLLENKSPTGFNTDIVLYHGSNCKFERFDKEMAGSNTGYQDADSGFFLTASESLAECYSVGCVGRSGGNKAIMSFCVRVEKPMIFKRSTDFYHELDIHKLSGRSLISKLKSEGYDSIIVRDDMEEVVIFDEENILPSSKVQLNLTADKKCSISSGSAAKGYEASSMEL